MNYSVFNIHDLMEQMGLDEVEGMLQSFCCPLNKEIEDFLHDKALPFTRQKMSVTYLVFNDDRELLGFFALAGKILTIACDKFSRTVQKKILRYGICNSDSANVQSFAYLIAQFGKNFNLPLEKRISGNDLMECVFESLYEVQRRIGGGIAFLECEDKPKLLDFYQHCSNSFTISGSRTSQKTNIDYIQLIHLF